MHKAEEFLHYLELATEKNPKEARFVLGHLFPNDLPVSEYMNFIRTK